MFLCWIPKANTLPGCCNPPLASWRLRSLRSLCVTQILRRLGPKRVVWDRISLSPFPEKWTWGFSSWANGPQLAASRPQPCAPWQNSVTAANHHFPTKRNATYIYISSLPSGLVSLRKCGCWFIRPSPARLPDADNIGGFSWTGWVFSINSLKPQPSTCALLFQTWDWVWKHKWKMLTSSFLNYFF